MIGPLEALLWLTLNIYHEARSESQFDQIAVAHVTINRAKETGKGVKYVVLKDRQFSWTHEKSDYWPHDTQAFVTCLESALVAAGGFDFTGGATHYHEKRIKPYWAKDMHRVGTFGAHKFYIARKR